MATLDAHTRRTRGDCLRAAVAVAYGMPYDDTPASRDGRSYLMNEVLSSGNSWERWAVERGLRWYWSWDFMPVFMRRWIAVVDALGEDGRRGEGELHAVVMEHEQLLYEPTEGRGPTYRAILPTDVRRAMWLDRADATDRFRGRCWRILQPERPRGPAGVFRHQPGVGSPERSADRGPHSVFPQRSRSR